MAAPCRPPLLSLLDSTNGCGQSMNLDGVTMADGPAVVTALRTQIVTKICHIFDQSAAIKSWCLDRSQQPK